jgi:hypothetical protein
MPTVPTYDNFQATPNTLPQARASLPTMPDVAGQQAREMGQGLQRVGSVLAQAAADEIASVDNARIQEQYSLLSKAANESLYGEAGVMQLQGKQAAGAAVKWNGDFDKIAGQLSEGLIPRQREKFTALVESTRRGMYNNVLRHEATQARLYKDEAYKALLAGGLETVGLNYRDGDMFALQHDIARQAMLQRPEYQRADAKGREIQDAELRGSFHAQVVNAALADNNTEFADAWYKANRDNIPLEQRGVLEKHLKPATDFAAGKQLALTAMERIAKGEPPAAVERELAEKAATPQAWNIAQGMLREQQDAAQRQAAQASGAMLERFELAPSHKTLNALLGDRAFQALEPETRGNLVKYMRAELEQADDRARARRNDQFRSPEAFQTFLDTLESPQFGALSRQEIYNLRPVIGPELTTKLLGEHKAVQGQAGRFQIDRKLIDDAIPKALLAKGNQDKENHFRGIVAASLIDWKARNPGKTPTPDEQMEIIGGASREYVVAGRLWGTNTVKAYELKPMPDDFRQQAISAHRQRGLPPPTQAELMRLWSQQKDAR